MSATLHGHPNRGFIRHLISRERVTRHPVGPRLLRGRVPAHYDLAWARMVGPGTCTKTDGPGRAPASSGTGSRWQGTQTSPPTSD